VKSVYFHLILLGILFPCLPSISLAQWVQTKGPEGGIVSCLVSNGKMLFAGSAGGGGVFRSTNNGVSWTRVNSGLTNTDIRALALHGRFLLAGTGSSGV